VTTPGLSQIPSRKWCNRRKETSREKWETDTTRPCDPTEQRNVPRLAKGVCRRLCYPEKRPLAWWLWIRKVHKNHPFLTHLLWLVGGSHLALRPKSAHTEILCKRISWIMAHTIVRQLVLWGKDVNLIGPLPHVAEEAFDGIGGLNMSVHDLRKFVKRVGLLLLFNQASHRFVIAFTE